MNFFREHCLPSLPFIPLQGGAGHVVSRAQTNAWIHEKHRQGFQRDKERGRERRRKERREGGTGTGKREQCLVTFMHIHTLHENTKDFFPLTIPIQIQDSVIPWVSKTEDTMSDFLEVLTQETAKRNKFYLSVY